jgi:hypothetical protein
MDWSKKANTSVTVRGVARNAKAGALLMAEGGSAILVSGIDEWNEQTVGRQVSVDAVVRRAPGYAVAGGSGATTSQGRATDREIWVLELERFRLLE